MCATWRSRSSTTTMSRGSRRRGRKYVVDIMLNEDMKASKFTVVHGLNINYALVYLTSPITALLHPLWKAALYAIVYILGCIPKFVFTKIGLGLARMSMHAVDKNEPTDLQPRPCVPAKSEAMQWSTHRCRYSIANSFILPPSSRNERRM